MIKFCPRCGSSNVQWYLPQDSSRWECKDCGYLGPLIIESEEIAKQIQKEYNSKKSKSEDESK